MMSDRGLVYDMSRARRGTTGPQGAFTNNLGIGAAIGAGAFVVNYVLTYVFVAIDGVDTDPIETWKFAGNLLYNAQFVDSEISGGGSSNTENVLSEASGDLTSTVPSLVYQAVPIIVLVVAGVLVVKQAQSRLDTGSSAAAGASIVGGYGVLAVLGVFLFEYSYDIFGQSISVAPEMVPAILLAGIAFPLVLGAIGGAIANEL